MISYVYLLFAISLVILLASLFLKKNKRINNILYKESNYNKVIKNEFDCELFNKVVFELISSFKYKLELYDFEDYRCIVSDPVGLFSWGFYYVIDFEDNKLNISLFPKFFEINKFGLFESRLNQLTSLIYLIYQNKSI